MQPNEHFVTAVWTIPNILSYLRVVLLLPLSLGLIASGYYGWSLVVLVCLGLTDWLDGFLARRLNQRTTLGEELDPIADRASGLLVSLAVVMAGILPWLLFALIVAADMVLLLLATVKFGGHPATQVTMIGKVRTALLLCGLPMLLLAAMLHSEALRVTGLAIVSVGVVLHCAAAAVYIAQMMRGTGADHVKARSQQAG